MKPSDFIGDKVQYDRDGQYFWGVKNKDNLQMIAELRGWGAIQNLFKLPKGRVDFSEAAAFQDEVGEWIAEAINEKLKREAEDLFESLFNEKTTNKQNAEKL